MILSDRVMKYLSWVLQNQHSYHILFSPILYRFPLSMFKGKHTLLQSTQFSREWLVWVDTKGIHRRLMFVNVLESFAFDLCHDIGKDSDSIFFLDVIRTVEVEGLVEEAHDKREDLLLVMDIIIYIVFHSDGSGVVEN